MATVDKLTLELEADGINAFIKAMDDAESGLQKVRENIQKTAKENGLMDKELDKSSKKKKAKDKKVDKEKNKSTKAFNKNLQDGTKSLDKMLKTLLAISGISFGISGLMSKSEQSAKDGADLSNQTRNLNASPIDIEAVNTALEASGMEKGLLNDFIGKLSANKSSHELGRGGLPEINDLINKLNGLGNGNIDYIHTDPIKTLKEMAKFLQSKGKNEREYLIGEIGLGDKIGQFLSDSDIFKNLSDGYEAAIKTQDRVKREKDTNAFLTLADKSIDNEWTKLAENLSGVNIALKQFQSGLLNTVNKTLTDIIKHSFTGQGRDVKFSDDVLNKVSSWVGTDNESSFNFDDKQSLIDNFFNKTKISRDLEGKVIELDKKIDYINNDTAYLNDGSSYKKGSYPPFGMSGYQIDYLTYAIEQQKKGQYIPQNSSSFYDNKVPSNQQLMQNSYPSQYATTNNSNGNIHINELIIQTTPEQAGQLAHGYQSFADLIKGSPVTLFNHLGNTK